MVKLFHWFNFRANYKVLKEFPHVLAICATYGRLNTLRRALSCFVEQDYQGEHTLLIFNNGPFAKILHLPDGIPANKHVKLINQPINSVSHDNYASLGEIYNDIINFYPESAELAVHWDDDDLYSPDHISEGVKGYNRCGKSAYKPAKSWFLTPNGTTLLENTMEPSIFVDINVLKTQGYHDGKNVEHHLKWVQSLTTTHNICSDREGKSTLYYTWGLDFGVWKTSGAGEVPNNFKHCRLRSNDHGDNIIYPVKVESYQHFFNVN